MFVSYEPAKRILKKIFSFEKLHHMRGKAIFITVIHFTVVQKKKAFELCLYQSKPGLILLTKETDSKK